MESYEIKYHLARTGHNVRAIADELGVTSQAVSQVIHGRDSSRRISQAVADAIGKPLEEVFPKYRKDKETHEAQGD